MLSILTIVELILVIINIKLLKVERVAQDSANTTKSADELVALGRTIRDKLERGTKVLELLGQPFQERHLIDDFHFLASLFVHEQTTILLLLLGGVKDDFSPLTSFNCQRVISKFSNTISVSAAPASIAFKVSLIP